MNGHLLSKAELVFNNIAMPRTLGEMVILIHLSSELVASFDSKIRDSHTLHHDLSRLKFNRAPTLVQCWRPALIQGSET
jgi:hypothetical protein